MAAVAVDDRTVGLPTSLALDHRLDAGAHAVGAAGVHPARHELVERGEQLVRESDRDLLGRHPLSIPEWDALCMSTFFIGQLPARGNPRPRRSGRARWQGASARGSCTAPGAATGWRR